MAVAANGDRKGRSRQVVIKFVVTVAPDIVAGVGRHWTSRELQSIRWGNGDDTFPGGDWGFLS